MITSLKIKNFKTLQNTGEVPLKPLNLLTGVNGTGKSSFVQALLLIRQSYKNSNLSKGNLTLKGRLVDIGTGKDALYYFAEKGDEQIKFEANFKNGSCAYWEVEYRPDSTTLMGVKNETNDKYYNDKIYYSLREQSLFSNAFQYLQAMHIDPQETYKEANIEWDNPLGLRGEYTIHYLNHYGNRKEIPFENLHHENARSKGLLHQVNAWLGEISPNVRLKTTKIPGSELIIAGYEFGTRNDYTDQFKPKNIGFGISYVLPVITAILSAEKGRLIILENPEAHLHPRGQARMGRLMALAAQNDVQLIVETHSDHILNGVRVAVKKGEVDAEKVGLLYFQREIENREHRSKIIIPTIDQDGRIDQWPDGFFDEWENMLDELI